MRPKTNIESVNSLAAIVRDSQATGKRIVLTNGCFDILHAGHVELLRRAREQGDVLIVAINADSSVRRLKGAGHPVFDQAERGELLAAMESVDYVCVFEQDTPLKTIQQIRPDVLVKGADWAPTAIVGREEVESWGGSVVVVPLVQGRSSTEIVERVLARFS